MHVDVRHTGSPQLCFPAPRMMFNMRTGRIVACHSSSLFVFSRIRIKFRLNSLRMQHALGIVHSDWT